LYSISAAEYANHNSPIPLIGNLYKIIDRAKGYGYTGLEIHIRDAQTIDGYRMQEYCSERDFAISAVVTGKVYTEDGLCFISDDLEIRQKAIQRIKGHIDLAAKLKCVVVIGWIRGIIPDQKNDKKYRSFFTQALCKLVSYAEKRNVIIVIEVLNRYEVNYLNNAAETLNLISQIGSSCLKVHLDTFHMNIEEDDMSASIFLCGNKLGYMHFADSNRKYPGAGHIDFTKISIALKKINYQGCLNIECLALPDAITAAKKGIAFLNTFM